MNMAKTEAEAGSPDQNIGPAPPKLTSEQVCNIGFAVLRSHNDDRLWRALTYDSGPYDLTTPNIALRDLGQAFYAAGCAAGALATHQSARTAELVAVLARLCELNASERPMARVWAAAQALVDSHTSQALGPNAI